MMCTPQDVQLARRGAGGSCFKEACPAPAQHPAPSVFAANVRQFGLARLWQLGTGGTSRGRGRAVRPWLPLSYSHGGWRGALPGRSQQLLFVEALI